MCELQVSFTVKHRCFSGRTVQSYSTGAGSTKFRTGCHYY